MIHSQPLPLFRPGDLSNFLTFSPPFLLYSFLTLTLSSKPHAADCNNQAKVVESYANTAQETIRKLAFEGVSSLEVVQSLCLLALKDILGNYRPSSNIFIHAS